MAVLDSSFKRENRDNFCSVAKSRQGVLQVSENKGKFTLVQFSECPDEEGIKTILARLYLALDCFRSALMKKGLRQDSHRHHR